MTKQEKLAKLAGLYVLPIGTIIFLTGLCILESRSRYHSLIYLFLSLPTLFITITNPSILTPAIRSKTFITTCLLCIFAAISTLWNQPDISDFRYIRYLINIILFIMSFIYLNHYQQHLLIKTILLAAIIWGVIGLFELYEFYHLQGNPLLARIIGGGNLTNTLLSSHVYGAFATFTASYYFINKHKNYSPLLIIIFFALIVFIIQTHSRTPLVGLAAAFSLLIIKYRNKQIILLTSCFLSAFLVYFAFNSELLMQRGFSYRPEIWLNAMSEVLNKPIIGHGLGSKISIYLPSINETFSEPHNLHIGLVYSLGFIGLAIWCTLIYLLFVNYKNNHKNILVLTGFPIFIFGVFSGMTEGASFFSRPKEVWFLIWFPMAMLIAGEIESSANQEKDT